MSKVAVIDFDGTIVHHCFPEIGNPLPGAFEVMKELKATGWKLILWTCREDHERLIDKQYLKKALEFCSENGVEFDAANESIAMEDFRGQGFTPRKPYAHVHIDDRNFGGFPGWDIIKKVLIDECSLEVDWKITEKSCHSTNP